MVLPDSHRVSRALQYLGTTSKREIDFAYGIFTLYDGPFQKPSAIYLFGNSLAEA
jgi:hypothetical protein